MADLDSEFALTEQQIQAGREALDERQSRQQADDRSHIAKLIVWGFVILIGVLVVAVIVGTYVSGWDAIMEPSKLLMTVLSSVMLPVVTLVIGYYFGNK